MRLLVLILFLLSRASMLAQTSFPANDWSRVETLAPGTHLVITNQYRFSFSPFAGRRSSCTLDAVAPDGLGCSSLIGTFWVSRAGIRQVHLADSKAVLIGAAIGAAVGAVLTIPNQSGGGTAGWRALIGGVIGSFFGFIIAKSIHPLGLLLYEQP